MLGRVREEGRNPAESHPLGLREPERREATALLLAGLPAPLTISGAGRR
jgi:hypothetical protein